MDIVKINFFCYLAKFIFLQEAKAIAVAAIALMALLVVIGNTTDYFTNYQFVEHVMKMDTIFPGSYLYHRRTNSRKTVHDGFTVTTRIIV